MPINYTEAEARVEFYADTIGVTPPARIVTKGRAPSPELLTFCNRYGASLDWIFLGDIRGMIRGNYRLARRN